MAEPLDSSLLAEIARVRRVLARELDTINEYESAALASSHPDVRAFLLHLAAEEKEHVAEATQVLRALDPGQEAHFAKPLGAAHYLGGASAGGASAGGASAPAPAPAAGAARPAAAAEPYAPVAPHVAVHAQQAPPSPYASPLTVGSLKRRDR